MGTLITTQSYRHEYNTGQEIPTQYGYLVETDFAGQQRLLRIETPTETTHDERIKTGLRGLHVWQGRVYIASWNRIHIVDYEAWQVVKSFDHPLMSDLHGLYVDEGGIWVTSSLIDTVLVFNHDHTLRRTLTLPATPVYPKEKRQPVDLTEDYRWRGKVKAGFRSFHANHVTMLDDKHVLVTGRGDRDNMGRVLKVHRESLRFNVWAGDLGGPHDGLWLSDGRFAVTETNFGAVAVLRPRWWGGTKLDERLEIPTTEGRYWTRGLCETRDGHLLVGRSVWKGDNRRANVVRMTPAGEVVAVHELDLPDYPECRIFQLVEAPA